MKLIKNLVLLYYISTVAIYANELSDFTTDGCSMWIDGYSITERSWGHCCIQHDIRYYGGGSRKLRKKADLELKKCIENVGAPKMANIIYKGVRVGGTPYSLAFYRWGYGWKKNRFYKPLTEEQLRLVEDKTKNIDIFDLDQITYPVTLDGDDLYL